MRKFQVVVNGQAYEVDVEEISGGAPAAYVAPAPVAAAPAPAPVAPAPAPAAAPAGAETVNAPMPGTILNVLVAAGDSVKMGQPLIVLEAMKMENEIPAPRDGVVASILTSKGATVNTGEALVALK